MKEKITKGFKVTVTVVKAIGIWLWKTLKLGMMTHLVFLAYEELSDYLNGKK